MGRETQKPARTCGPCLSALKTVPGLAAAQARDVTGVQWRCPPDGEALRVGHLHGAPITLLSLLTG